MKKDKIKDMIRSILPSKARRRARFTKAMLNRMTRHAVRRDLHVENPDADLRRKPYFGVMLRDRRGADKLNHFMRWCSAVTEGMSDQDALSHVKSILPDSLIGQHAYGHWEAHRKPRPYRVFVSSHVPYEKQEQSFIDSTTFRLRRALKVDPSLHGRLNAEIKARTPEDQQWRVLAGVHDVEAFVRDINWLERKITLELIEQIEKQKGGRKVALRVLPLTAGQAIRRLSAPLSKRQARFGEQRDVTGSAALSPWSRAPRALCARRPRRAMEPRGRCAPSACPRRSRRTILRRANSIRRMWPCTRPGSAG